MAKGNAWKSGAALMKSNAILLCPYCKQSVNGTLRRHYKRCKKRG